MHKSSFMFKIIIHFFSVTFILSGTLHNVYQNFELNLSNAKLAVIFLYREHMMLLLDDRLED